MDITKWHRPSMKPAEEIFRDIKRVITRAQLRRFRELAAGTIPSRKDFRNNSVKQVFYNLGCLGLTTTWYSNDGTGMRKDLLSPKGTAFLEWLDKK